ncbi:MAG: CotH kinase family protein, partial [Oscillospiraceae bacterium]|nr:CotH kinase family protein [Oscillospiraceae bacterium]
ELDARAGHGDTVEDEDFVTVNGMLYDIRWAGSSSQRTPAHVAYAKDYLYAVSEAIRSQDFEDILELIDLDTFVDFYIIQELVKNGDAHFLSVFMHISGQGAERRLYMGPLWDFDKAAGNMRGQELGDGPELLFVAVLNYWYRYLMGIPEFFEAVVTRWNEVRDVEIAQTIDHIHAVAVHHQAEFERNFERHPMAELIRPESPTPPDAILAVEPTFMAHVDYLVSWLSARVLWLDDFFNGRFPAPYDDPLWGLVTFHTYEAPVHLTMSGELQDDFLLPAIRLRHTVMLTMQDMAKVFGLTAEFDHASNTVILTNESLTITHEVGTAFFTVDGQALIAPNPSILISEYIFLPLRTIADILGYDIRWQEDTRMVSLEAIDADTT